MNAHYNELSERFERTTQVRNTERREGVTHFSFL